MGEYTEYKYKRYRRPKRIFVFVVAVIAVLIIAATANIFFGFISFASPSGHITVQSVTFYAVESQDFSDKADAIRYAALVKTEGGCGYLRATGENNWKVIIDICHREIQGAQAYQTREKNFSLTQAAHREAVEGLLGTFKTTFDTLCNYGDRLTAGTMTNAEVTTAARLAYNNLVELTHELEDLQANAKNPDYAQLLIYVTRQLLGLNLVWLEGSSVQNLAQVLKNAQCWVIFAYLDLTEQL